jgi:hypothetical protein
MLRALILLHRWLGMAFCLLFAMWFATGIVMHFVPFPALTEAERFAGLTTIDLARVEHGPAAAVAASGIGDATRVRLMQRSDGPVYLIWNSARVTALRADDLSDATVHSPQLALAIALDYAGRRQWDAAAASVAALSAYDQWTVPNGFDLYRPLYRVALNDGVGTELYVSAATGEVVLDTTRRERAWNYVGSVAHWLYPTALRSHPAIWSRLLWWLSLIALIAAIAGAAVGTLRVGAEGSRLLSPYRGWQALHHGLGLGCMLFVLTWIFSGWLSMDDGRLFSTGKPSDAEAAKIAGMPIWQAVPDDELQHIAAAVKEVDWFAFGGRVYRRERIAIDRQRLSATDAGPGEAQSPQPFLRAEEIAAAANVLAPSCRAPVVIDAGDDYAVAAAMPDAPIFRSVCGGVWLDFDGSSGTLLQRLDSSRRTYRWLYGALHTLDFPVLKARPAALTTLIVALCGCGFVFSLTGVVIAWRRLLSCLRPPERR